MQDHEISKSNHRTRSMPRRALWMLGIICLASAAYAPTALAGVDNGGCSKHEKWGIARAQTCINNSAGPNLVTADAYVNIDGSCSTCQFRFVLQLKRDIPWAIDEKVAEAIFPFRTGRLAIENTRVVKGKYYTFLRLEVKEGENWIRVHTQESPRQNVR